MTFMGACDSPTLRQVQWLNGQVVQNRPDRQKVGREHLVPAGRQCVSFPSAPVTSLISTRTRHTVKRKTRICDAPYPSGFMVLHESIALHLVVTLGGAEFIPARKSASAPVPKRGHSANCLLPGTYNDNDLGSDPGMYIPEAVHFPVRHAKP